MRGREGAWSVLWLGATLGWAACDAGETFSNQIQPVLKEKCQGCHGAGQTLSKLDLRTRDAALKGGTRGPALVPGKSSESLLMAALEGREMERMPPGKNAALSAATIAAFREWIDGGAPFAEAKAAAKWTYKEEDLWAFQPLKKPAGSSVDEFINRTLGGKGLKPAGRAGKPTLIRRATFDLTGLPPTPEEVDAFVKDSAADAYKKLVERLLASPRYGERWGRHWLDVVRYADSDGYSNDFERPNAWRYRDYVMRAFNQDKPYDRFILEQIAGDEPDPVNPGNLIATGFLRLGPWEHTAMSVAAVTRQMWLDDVRHSTATVFLGLTAGCARCHDHKFDPLPTRDYYSMQAVFAASEFAERPAAFLNAESRAGFDQEARRIEALIEWCKKRLEESNAQENTRKPESQELERRAGPDVCTHCGQPEIAG